MRNDTEESYGRTVTTVLDDEGNTGVYVEALWLMLRATACASSQVDPSSRSTRSHKRPVQGSGFPQQAG
jgi:hypothetical protein